MELNICLDKKSIFESKQKEYAIKIDEIHTSIVLALQKHLRKTQARTRSIFAKGFVCSLFANLINYNQFSFIRAC